MKSFLFCVLFLCALLATTSASQEPELGDDTSGYTPAEIKRNEQRKAFGLPPIPPRALKKSKVAKKRSKPKQAGMAPLMATQTSIGYIAIHEDSVDGLLLGYLNCHKIVQTINEATEYTYTTTGYVTDIGIVADPKMRMCIMTGLYGKQLGLGLKNFHLARHTHVSTGAGNVPFHDLHSASYLETTVFNIDASSGEITVEWVNPDGSHPPIQIALREERIYYTGDMSSFKEYLGNDEVTSVAFKWIALRPAS